MHLDGGGDDIQKYIMKGVDKILKYKWGGRIVLLVTRRFRCYFGNHETRHRSI